MQTQVFPRLLQFRLLYSFDRESSESPLLVSRLECRFGKEGTTLVIVLAALYMIIVQVLQYKS